MGCGAEPRDENFGDFIAENAVFPARGADFFIFFELGVQLYRMLRNAPNADARMHSWRSEGTTCGLLLLLLPLLRLLAYQQTYSRAPGTHRRPKTIQIELS